VVALAGFMQAIGSILPSYSKFSNPEELISSQYLPDNPFRYFAEFLGATPSSSVTRETILSKDMAQ
jgi:hypothetical protein